MPIPLIKSGFYKEEETRRALAEFVLTAERFSMGSACAEFERMFAQEQGRRHAVYVTSGSAANLILLQALLNLGRLKAGDAVGFSALTWATNPMPIIQLGLRPVPLDCALSTLNLSPEILEQSVAGLRAVFVTNVLGFCDALDTVAERCREAGVLLLEDNCESLGSSLGGKLLGNFGEASTFSFFVGHHLSTIEGGMVCTDDPVLHEMLVMARAHGWDRNLSPEAQQRLRAEHGIDAFNARYAFYDLAYNTRPTEIQGFLGTRQLPYLEEMITLREGNFRRFAAALHARPDRYLPLNTDHMDRVSNFAMPVVCIDDTTADAARARFEKAGVEIRPVIAGDMTRQPFYRKYCPPASCPNAGLVHRRGLYFGNNPEMTEEEISTLCSLLTNDE